MNMYINETWNNDLILTFNYGKTFLERRRNETIRPLKWQHPHSGKFHPGKQPRRSARNSWVRSFLCVFIRPYYHNGKEAVVNAYFLEFSKAAAIAAASESSIRAGADGRPGSRYRAGRPQASPPVATRLRSSPPGDSGIGDSRRAPIRRNTARIRGSGVSWFAVFWTARCPRRLRIARPS